MKVFAYITKRGTEIKMIIKSAEDVVAVIKNKGTFKVFPESIIFDREQDNCISLKIDKTGNNGEDIYINTTDEIYKHIKELKEEERIAKLPLKQQIKAKMKKLKAKINFTYFVDADLVTGIKYYALTQRVDKKIWSKIKKYFTYIDTSYHSDDFDAMYGSNYKGYLTSSPDKVEEILKNDFDVDALKKKIVELEKELREIEKKEENDKIYKRELLKKEVEKVKKQFRAFKNEIEKINFEEDIKSLKESKIKPTELLKILLGNKKEEQAIYDPTNIPKIISDVYSGGYVYMTKEKDEDFAIIPTKKHIVVALKNNFDKKWWNQYGGIVINGYFAPYGFTNIKIFPYKDDILNLLEKFGYIFKNYKEDGKWFIVTNGDYALDIMNVVTLSEDYDDWVKTDKDVLQKFENEKRWEWKGGKYPAIENIKYIGKFKKLEE